jgi:hypothetical protein
VHPTNLHQQQQQLPPQQLLPCEHEQQACSTARYSHSCGPQLTHKQEVPVLPAAAAGVPAGSLHLSGIQRVPCHPAAAAGRSFQPLDTLQRYQAFLQSGPSAGLAPAAAAARAAAVAAAVAAAQQLKGRQQQWDGAAGQQAARVAAAVGALQQVQRILLAGQGGDGYSCCLHEGVRVGSHSLPHSYQPAVL